MNEVSFTYINLSGIKTIKIKKIKHISAIMHNDLEKVISEKIRPIIDTSMQKFMGVTIKELSTDISHKLKRTPLLDFKINTSLPFKKAKNLFKKDYIKKLLEMSQGSIADVARISGVDRRSIHRFTKDIKKDINKLRKGIKQSYKTGTVINSMIEESLGTLKDVIKPEKLDNVYKNVTAISKDILRELPIMKLTLKQALNEFEKEYLKKAIRQNEKNISKTAKSIGVRAETLFRKLKKLGLS